MRKSASFTLSDGIRDGLTTFAKSYSCPRYLHYRASIILNAEKGLANGEIGSMTGFHSNTVRKWRTRFFSELPRLLEIEERNPEELMNEPTINKSRTINQFIFFDTSAFSFRVSALNSFRFSEDGTFTFSS